MDGDIMTRVCIRCGREFTVTRQQLQKHFCSPECRDRHSYAIEPDAKGELDDARAKICQNCGSRFVPLRKDTIFCCRKCCNTFHNKKHRAEEAAKKTAEQQAAGKEPKKKKTRQKKQPAVPKVTPKKAKEMSLAEMNWIARQQGKSYGQLQAELYTAEDKPKRKRRAAG